MGALSSINIRFKVDLAEFSSQMQNVSRQVQKSAATLKNVGGNLSTYVTLPVLGAAAASVKFASDYEESLNKVNVAFGDSEGYVKNWAKTSLESYGIAEGTALDMTSLYGDMATSMNLPQKEAAKMATSLTGLAGDLASFKNIGIDQATTALNGVFTGETESLKRIGVVMTEANLQAFAYTQGINKQVQKMTEAEKVNLRYAYVMAKTTNAQGDFERTGGGAANQMRVFTESLKQVAQQLGAIILPIVTKVITYINEKIKAFSNLSETSKTLIISIAGIAAAIGPLLSGLGSVLGFLPNMISSIGNVGKAWTALTALLAANPFTAIAAVLATIVSVTLIAGSRFTELTNATEEFAKVTATASSEIAKEKVELDKNLAVAKNEKLSKEERKKAIENLNAISPQYLGNLTLENINTKLATESIGKYNQALLTKAKVMAAQDKLVEVQKKLLDLQMGQLDAVKPSIWQSLGNAVKAVVSPMGAMNVAAAYSIEQTKSMAGNLKVETSELTKLQSKLVGFLGDNKEFAETTATSEDAVSKFGNSLDKVVKPGTVAYFEQLKSKLEEQQKTIPTTNAAWLDYENKINDVTEKIKNFTNVKKEGTVDFYNDEISGLKKLQSELATTSMEFQFYEQQIQSIQDKIDDIEQPVLKPITQDFKLQIDSESDTQDRLKEYAGGLELVKVNTDTLTASQQRLAEIGTSVGTAVSDTFSSLANGVVGSLDLASTGFEGFIQGLLGTVTKLISMMLASSISQSIAGATAAGTATGPAAIFTTPAFIATAVGGVLAAFAAIPKFEFGGVVGGSSFYGDKILARVNSGELILNQKQQAGLFGMIGSAAPEPSLVLNGGFKISGSDIELVVERAMKKNNRTR
jgi:hypothetical protein